MRLRDDDISDSDSEEPSNNILSWRNDNTIIQTKSVAGMSCNTSTHKHFLNDSYKRRDERRKRSPLSVRSVRSCQRSIGLQNFSNFPNRTLVDRTRGATPMSLRSVSNFGSTVSTQDIKNVLETYLKNCTKNDINDFMHIIKRRACRKRPKIKKMRSLTKGAHMRYGGDSGDHCSNSSDSSVESKISRHTIAYRSTNSSIQNQSSRLNRRNHDNKLLTSMNTASTSNILQCKATQIVDDVDSFRTRDWDAVSSTNIDSRIITRMSVDDDVRSIRSLPSAFNPNYRFKNMFSLGSKVYDNSENRKRTNCLSKIQNEHTLRQNVSTWSLNSFSRSVPIFSSKEKDKGKETDDEELACSNKNNCNKFYDKSKHANVDNDRNHNNDDINLAGTKNSFRMSNRHNNDNKSVRSEPSIIKNNKTLSKSKAPSKNSLDIVPRLLDNATSHNDSVNNFFSTSQIKNSSMHNGSRLGKTFNNLMRVPPIEETDENDDVSDECPTTINGNNLIENQLKFGETNTVNAKEKQIFIFGGQKQACMEQNEQSLNISKKRDGDNVPAQYMPSIFSYNSNLCSKPVAYTRNVFSMKMRPSNNTLLENKKMTDLTSRFHNEISSDVPLKVANNSITKPFIAHEQGSSFHKGKLLASSNAIVMKNKNGYGNIVNDSDDDENIIFSKSDVGLRVNTNDGQKQHNITSALHVSLKPKTKTTSVFIFAKPRTPRPLIKSKSKNNTIHCDIPSNNEARIPELSNNVPELMQQSDEEENIFYKCNRNAKEHNHVADGYSKQNLKHTTIPDCYDSSKSKDEAMANSVLVKPKTSRPQIEAKPKDDEKSSKKQSYKMRRSSDPSVNTSESTQPSSDISIRPSFIKRKLFTQTLEITENSQNDSSESLPQSPVCNIYSTKPNDHKAHRSLLPKSLLRVDIDDHDLQRNQSNMSQLVQKIVPQKRISALTQNVQRSHKLQDNENSDDDRWDVISIMSVHNKDDISDTYSDTGSDQVNVNSNNDFEYNKEAKVHKKSQMELRKLTTQQLNNSKKEIDEPKTGAQNSDKLQVNAKCNIISKRAENLTISILKSNARSSQNFKTVKNQINEEVKSSDKIKETLKTRRKRLLSEINDPDVLGSQSKRAKTSCSICIDNNKIVPCEKKHENHTHSAKKSIGVLSQKSNKENVQKLKKITQSNVKLNNKDSCKKNNANCQEIRLTRNSLNRSLQDSLTVVTSESIHSKIKSNKELNMQKAKRTESNVKFNNKDKCEKNNANCQEIRLTRNSINRSLQDSLTVVTSESIHSQIKSNKELNMQKAKRTESNVKFNNKDKCEKNNGICQGIRVTRNSINRSLHDSLTMVPPKRIHSRIQKAKNLDTSNKQAKALSGKRQVSKVNSKKPTVVSEIRSRKEADPEKVKILDSNNKSQNLNNDCIKKKQFLREIKVICAPLSQDSFDITTSDNAHNRRTSRKDVVHRESKMKIETKILRRWRSNEDITTSRRTRQSLLRANEESSKDSIIQKHNKKELCNSNIRKADISKDQNAILTENRSKDIYSKNVQRLGIAKSRFDIVPRHCSRGRLGCDGDNKTIISTSIVMTRSKSKL